MKDREKVLRFFALAHRRAEYTSGPFRSFLNAEMKVNQHAASDGISRFEKEFLNAVTWVKRVFAGQEFRMFRVGTPEDPNGSWDRRMDLIYDVEMVGFHEFIGRLGAIESEILSAGRSIDAFTLGLRRRLINVMTNETFQNTLREQTLKPHVLRRRFELWFDAIRKATEDWQ